jgi:hypothetical protein
VPDADTPEPGAVSLDALGERLHQVLLDAYQSHVGGSTLFAFVPGGIPVPDTLVQDGTVNPLQVTTWLATVAETPLAVDVAESAVTSSFSSLLRAADMYGELVRYALPVATADSPAGQRFLTMRNAAAAAVPGQAALASEPPDWPLPSVPYWTKFDTSDDQSTASTTTTTTPSPPNRRRLWQLRLLPPIDHLDPPALRIRPDLVPSPGAVPTANVDAKAAPGLFVPLARTATSAEALPPRRLTVIRTRVDDPPGDAKQDPPIVLRTLPFARAVLAFDGPDQTTPATTGTTATTTRQSVSVSLEHTVVTIDRSSWWSDGLVRDPGWYIPGLGRGAWVADTPADGNVAVGLPVALLLIKALTVKGTFSDQDVEQMRTGNAVLGPFGFANGTSSSVDGTTTIASDGMQLIGMFCAPLPVLPPQDGLTTPPPADDPDQNATSPSNDPIQTS